MASQLSIYALNEYAAVFQRFGTIPVRWDRPQKKFIYRCNHRELLLWYFNMTVVFLGTFCCGVICLREILVKVSNISRSVLVIQMFLGLMGAVVGCGFGVLLLIYGELGTTAWDNMWIIVNKLNKGT